MDFSHRRTVSLSTDFVKKKKSGNIAVKAFDASFAVKSLREQTRKQWAIPFIHLVKCV